MKNTRGFLAGASRKAKRSLFFLLTFTVLGIGNLFSQQQTSDFEFILVMFPGIATSLASEMGSNNIAFTSEGGPDINELHSLLRNSIGSPTFNEANYQRLVDFIMSSLLFVDLVTYFSIQFNIPREQVFNPTITNVGFYPTSTMSPQVSIDLDFGGHSARLGVAREPGVFMWSMSDEFDFRHLNTTFGVRHYFITQR